MSFILDALKKSENDRQRQSGPALFEVRVPPPRSKFPLLAIAIVSLLVVNLGVVAWLMFRKPGAAEAPPSTATTAEAKPAQAETPSSNQPQQQPYAAQSGNPAQQGYAGQGYGPQPGMAPPAGAYGQNGYPPPNNGAFQQAPNGTYPPPPNSGAYFQREQGGNPNGYQQGGYQQPPNAGGYGQNPSAGGFGTAGGPLLAEGGNEPVNPDDYAPAREPAPPPTQGRVTRATESGLPTYEEVAAKTQIPNLHMDLHSYAPDPAKRFVLVNMRRLYEGQSTADGVKVESITNDAAIMSYNGTRFVLDSE
jgi:general secretion pathway protein B